MESLEISKLFGSVYKGKKVLVTGHTGFKGSWLALWLKEMNADVYGLALEPNTIPNHYTLLDIGVKSYIQDINDLNGIKEIFQVIKPDIVFHLAAQPIVRISYTDPIDTFKTNIIGSANILEASRYLENLKAVVMITTDKCYDNKEWIWGYRENDPMGGKDPYSASKGCAEIVINSFRCSFFNKSSSPLVASVRAGNVIGGGDWAKDRILTDIVTAASRDDSVYLRFPNATRPWQYVLEPLSGYLAIGEELLLGNKNFADAWNIGPNQESNVSVLELVKTAQKYWDKILYDFDKGENPHEAEFLMLDNSKANQLLKWQPVWNFQQTIRYTINWYKEYYNHKKIISKDILYQYITDAQKKQLKWSCN
jgi:CDP-glucose 4,6-dehydratase